MQSNLSLLYIEDDKVAQQHYANAFKLLFKDVYIAQTIKAAQTLNTKYSPDILLVDINLPDGDGLDFIKQLRLNNSDAVVIILSAFSHREYLLRAVELHLFKYLIKPIKNSELLLVLKEAIVLALPKEEDALLQINSKVQWNPQSFSLVYQTQAIQLSLNENRLIELLMSNTKKIFSLNEIEDFVFNDSETHTQQAIKNLINRLRKKIDFPFIENHYSIGYQIIN